MTEVRYCRTKLGEEDRERMDRSYGLSDHTCHKFSETKNYYCWSKDLQIQPKEPTVPPEQHIQKLSEADYKELDGKKNGQTEAPDTK